MTTLKQRYTVTGRGEPLLLISGLNADRAYWGLSVPLLSQHFQVIVVDNRGVGQFQNFDQPCTTALMAADIIELLDTLKVDRVHVVGHSMGGAIVQQMAIHYPAYIKKIIICSGVARLSFLRLAEIQNNIDMMHSTIPRDLFIKKVLFNLFANKFISQSGMLDLLIKQSKMRSVDESRQSYIYQAQALLQHDTTAELAKVTMPCLVIGGEEDVIVQAPDLKAFAAKLPNALCQLVPEVGHMLPIEAPEIFCKTVVDFLTT